MATQAKAATPTKTAAPAAAPAAPAETTEALVQSGSDVMMQMVGDDRPAHITNTRRGMETISKSDMSLPRLALAQAMSPEVQEGTPTFVEGLKPGDLFNSVSKENYGRKVIVQIVRKDNLRAMEFIPIENGGGVADPNVPLSDDRCKWHGEEPPVATIFRDYLAIIHHEDGRRELIALSFKASSLKVAKLLNGLIAMRGADIFAGLYELTTGTETKPQPHKVFKVDNAGWVGAEDFEKGGKLWAALKDLDVEIEREAPRPEEQPTEPIPF